MNDQRRASQNTENIFLAKGGSCQGRGLLVVNPPDTFRSAHESGYKSGKNDALYTLRGLHGVVRRADNCCVLTLGQGEEICVGTAGQLTTTTDAMNVLARTGSAWWCKDTNGGGQASVWVVASNTIAAGVRAAKIARENESATREIFRAANDRWAELGEIGAPPSTVITGWQQMTPAVLAAACAVAIADCERVAAEKLAAKKRLSPLV